MPASQALPVPAAPRQQPTLEGFYQPSDAIVLRSRAVRAAKTLSSKSKGNFISDKFAVRDGQLSSVNVDVRGKASRGRVRSGKASLKPATKLFCMPNSKRQSLIKQFGCFETVNSGNGCVYLRCSCCYDYVIDSKFKATPSHIKEHIASEKHRNMVALRDSEMASMQSIASALNVQVMSPDDRTNVFRARFVEALTTAGIALNKCDDLRPFMQEHCHVQLMDSSNLRKFVPVLRDSQKQEIRDAAKKYPIFVTHDGTNRFSEFYAIVARWVDDQLQLHERLVVLEAYTGKHNAAGLLAMIHAALQDLGIDSGNFISDPVRASQLLGMQRDREATNTLAAAGLKNLYAGSFDLECCSHGLVKVGEKMPTPHLVAFKDMLTIACNSAAFKSHCKSFTGTEFRKPSNIRWWSVWELYASFLEESADNRVQFDIYLESFRAAVAQDRRVTIAGATEDSIRILRLADFANNDAEVDAVRLELVCIVSVAKPFVQATYALEGAGCCVMEAYKWLQDLRYWVSLDRMGDLSFPGLRAQIERSAAFRQGTRGVSLDEARTDVEREVREIIRPALVYCQRVFDEELKEDFKLYCFASSMNPYDHSLYFQNNSPETWRSALHEHFGLRFSRAEVDAMLLELPTLHRHVDGFIAELSALPDSPESRSSDNRNQRIWLFWQRILNLGECPHLRKLVQLILTIVPSSACCERCFSLLKHMFTTQQLIGEQRGVLEDNIGLSVAAKFKANNLANAFHRH